MGAFPQARRSARQRRWSETPVIEARAVRTPAGRPVARRRAGWRTILFALPAVALAAGLFVALGAGGSQADPSQASAQVARTGR